MNFLSLVYQKMFILLSDLKDIFTRYWILIWQFSYSGTLKVLYCILALVSGEKLANINIAVLLYVMGLFFFPSATLKCCVFFTSVFLVFRVRSVMCLRVDLCTYFACVNICKFIFSTKLTSFQLLFLKLFSCLILFSLFLMGL